MNSQELQLSLEKALTSYWGHTSFLPLQQQAMEHIIQGQDSIVVLPTGGGKSLCFQAPAVIMEGLTVVVSPLISLMKDQVDGLKEKTGYEAGAAIHGMLTMPERSAVLESIRLGDISILYLWPEQLRNKTVKKALLSRQIGGWVVEKARCLAKWGHDFRPDCLNC